MNPNVSNEKSKKNPFLSVCVDPFEDLKNMIIIITLNDINTSQKRMKSTWEKREK